ncbi:hypothetical protein [Janthinobacterium sp. RT4P48]|uniref:hypothetical protein n=1 Tax=Janthinobacterium sp. RT4P48 TaxID=3424188 RepID=UPI003F24E5F4
MKIIKFAGSGLAILLALLAGSAQAQYAPVDAERTKNEAAAKLMLESLKETRYWIVPNPQAISRYEFQELDEDGNPAGKKFVVTETTSFTVHSYVDKDFRHYARIVFEDDKDAALEISNYLFDSRPGPLTLFRNVYDPAKRSRLDFVEYLFTSPPKDIEIAEAKEGILEIIFESALRAKGDVNIGMSAKQVRASGWGKPVSMHKKSDAAGAHEEWLYESRRSLLFTNGKLASIRR